MSDLLDQEIIGKRRERDELRVRLSTIETELRMLERAAELRPLPSRAGGGLLSPGAKLPAAAANAPNAKGKAPGTLSNNWRQILEKLSPRLGFGLEELQDEAQAIGAGASMASIRDRVRALRGMGYVDDGVDGLWVTDAFRERFMNKAPRAEAPGPAEISHQGDQTAAA